MNPGINTITEKLNDGSELKTERIYDSHGFVQLYFKHIINNKEIGFYWDVNDKKLKKLKSMIIEN